MDKKTIGWLVVALALLVFSAVAVEYKKDQIREQRAAPVKTILNEILEHGTAVNAYTVNPKDFSYRIQVVLSNCNGRACFEMSRSEVSNVRSGSSIFTDSTNEKIGAVTSIAGQASIATGLYQVGSNIDFKKVANEAVVWVETDRKRNVLVVPLTALDFVGEDQVVYKLDEDNNVETVKVKVGARNGSDAWLINGIQSGDRVITAGKSLINRYKKVNVVESESRS